MKKICLFLVALFINVALNAQPSEQEIKYWEPVITAVAKVESGCNPKAVSKSGVYVGYLQISPVVVYECNNILKKKVYTLNDRYDIQKSKEMFVLIQSKYNTTKDFVKGIRIWNGGPKGHTNKKTLGYCNKVLKHV